MANVNIQYSCGCGQLFNTLEAAMTHCDGSGHTMTVSGKVKPDVPAKLRKKLSGTSMGLQRQTMRQEESMYDKAKFIALKAKLGRK